MEDRARRSTAAVTGLIAALLVAPGAARATGPPEIVSGPEIEGVPEVAQTLTARARWRGGPASWQWLRCEADGNPCAPVPDATEDTLVVRPGHVGSVLRVRLKVTNPHGTAERRSEPTAVVTAAPEPPAVPEPPSSSPPPPEPPSPTPVASEPEPAPPPPPTPPQPTRAVAPLTASAPAPPLLHPFPVVRIKGELTARGARVTLLTVRTPRGVWVSVRCTGRSCPARKVARAAALVRLRRFERELRAGTRLDIAVERPGYVGKHTTLVIRRGAPPRRSDRCLYPGAARPLPCPAL